MPGESLGRFGSTGLSGISISNWDTTAPNSEDVDAMIGRAANKVCTLRGVAHEGARSAITFDSIGVG